MSFPRDFRPASRDTLGTTSQPEAASDPEISVPVRSNRSPMALRYPSRTPKQTVPSLFLRRAPDGTPYQRLSSREACTAETETLAVSERYLLGR